MKTSFIIVSRERVVLLKNCLSACFTRAENPENVEAILIVDDDDETYYGFEEYIKECGWNIRIYSVPRSNMWQRDYNNFGAKQCVGDLLWGLNDDAEIVTEKWDVHLYEYVKEIYNKQKDKILYLGVDDGTHGPNTLHDDQPSSCFPIVSKETFNALQAIFPNEIHMWGGDSALYNIFSKAKARRFFRHPSLKVVHHSIHSKESPREKDNIFHSVASISHKTQLTVNEEQNYIDRLNASIVE